MPAGSSTRRLTPARRPAGVAWRTWLADVPSRVRAHGRLKAALAAAMALLFCGPYFLIGHHPLLPVRELPLTWVDRAVGYHPYEWVWVYQSVYVPVNVIPWLATRRRDLARYAWGFALLSLVSFAVFVACPIRAPKPPMPDATGMYRLLLWYDAPQNSLPSLHAGLLVYTLCFGRRLFGPGLPRGLGLLCVGWAGLILCGTLTTKEHYLVDIVAGAALAVAADAWIWRRRKARPVTNGPSDSCPPPTPGIPAEPARVPGPLPAGS